MYPRKLMADTRGMRLFGYAFTFVVHVANVMYMEVTRERGMTDDIHLQTFQLLRHRYFTGWTVMLQLLNVVLGFASDALSMIYADDKQYKPPDKLEKSRYIMFSACVWPCSMVVFTVFWSIYLYDRSLIFPVFLDQIVGDVSNHVIHTLIVPIAIWEIRYCPRYLPRSHMKNLRQMVLYMAVYLSVFYYTYYEHGVWLYPIFEKTHGTIYFILIHLFIAGLFIFFYYLQWVLNYMFHGDATIKGREAIKLD